MTGYLDRMVTLLPVKPAGPPLRAHLIGDDDLAGGVGGWEAIARPRRTEVPEWTGTPLWTLGLPLMLEHTEMIGQPYYPIEAEIRQLIALGLPTDATGEPPLLRVTGPVRVPDTRMRWVLADLQWGGQMRDDRGRRIQQEVTVTLMEYVRGDILKGPAAKARKRKGKGKRR